MRRSSNPRPTGDLQLAVLQLLWERGAATLADIRTALASDRPIANTTVATVLSRLEQSGLVSYREGDRSRVYSAAVPQAEMQRVHTRRLVDRLFGGRAADLIAHLVRESEIDEDELTRLRKLVRERRRS
jgi:BlaI family transcriptional regulator, penicillinase repressor